MRTVSVPFDSALFQEGTSFARLWRITRSDGAVLSITDAAKDVNLNGEIFRHDMGFTASAVYTSALNISGQSCEIKIAMQDNGLSESDLRAKRYEDAEAVLLVVDYTNVSAGVMTMFRGKFGRVKLNEKGVATIEVISFVGKNRPLATRQYSQSCPYSVGDVNCRFPIDNIAAHLTVTAVVDSLSFKVSTMMGQANNFYQLGQLVFKSGGNTGAAVDVMLSTAATLTVGLFYRPQVPIVIGDTAIMYPGCDRQLLTCRDKFNNVANFGGQPFNPQWTVQA